ncbi:hypothetical protein, partial [Pseudomonas sp. MPR-AND1A]|uniref:hypothetical protein n=1 Tax=Pseudomonas sp. MPR-AND1A TaxID=2070600 RepID=UPI000CC26EA5
GSNADDGGKRCDEMAKATLAMTAVSPVLQKTCERWDAAMRLVPDVGNPLLSAQPPHYSAANDVTGTACTALRD